jgi:toxin ParE1/3/4
MSVSYSRRALAQLDGIFEYVARDDPAAAKRLIQRIEQLIQLLGRFPLMGRTTNRQNVRIFGVPGYPYLVFYRIFPESNEIRVLRVRHAARRPITDDR